MQNIKNTMAIRMLWRMKIFTVELAQFVCKNQSIARNLCVKVNPWQEINPKKLIRCRNNAPMKILSNLVLQNFSRWRMFYI
jgi:hypothetical protein